MAASPDVEVTERQLALADLPERLRALVDYWQAKRGPHRMPSRDEIDPLDLRDILGWVSLVELSPQPPRFVFRVFGSHLGFRPTGGRDRRGTDAVQPAAYRVMIERHYQEVADCGEPRSYRVAMAFREHCFTYERVTLPLGRDRPTPDMLLLGSSFDRAARARFFDLFERAARGDAA